MSIHKDAVILTSVPRRAAAWIYRQMYSIYLGRFLSLTGTPQESLSRHIHQKCAPFLF